MGLLTILLVSTTKMWSSYPYPWSVMAPDFIMIGPLACLPYSEASFQTDIFRGSQKDCLYMEVCTQSQETHFLPFPTPGQHICRHLHIQDSVSKLLANYEWKQNFLLTLASFSSSTFSCHIYLQFGLCSFPFLISPFNCLTPHNMCD